MTHPALWIPAGNWAEWVGSALAGGSLLLLAYGLKDERRARRQDESRRREEATQHQASQVGGWISPVLDPETGLTRDDVWRLHVANSSDLPIRAGIGYLFRALPESEKRIVGAFPRIPVIPPNTTNSEAVVQLAEPEGALNIVIAFNDEATLRWRKHMHAPIEMIPTTGPDIDPGDVPDTIFRPSSQTSPPLER